MTKGVPEAIFFFVTKTSHLLSGSDVNGLERSANLILTPLLAAIPGGIVVERMLRVRKVSGSNPGGVQFFYNFSPEEKLQVFFLFFFLNLFIYVRLG